MLPTEQGRGSQIRNNDSILVLWFCEEYYEQNYEQTLEHGSKCPMWTKKPAKIGIQSGCDFCRRGDEVYVHCAKTTAAWTASPPLHHYMCLD